MRQQGGRWCVFLGSLLLLTSAISGSPFAATTPTPKPKFQPKKKLRQLKWKWTVGYTKSGGRMIRDSWVPVHLEITNETEREFKCHVRYTVMDERSGNSYKVVYKSPEIILSKSVGTNYPKKWIVQHVYLPKSPVFATILVDMLSTTHLVGSSPPSTSAGARGRPDYNRKKTGASGQRALLTLRAPNRDLNIPDAHDRISNMRIDAGKVYLPRHWVGYGGMSTVIWDGMDLTRNFPPSAEDALKDYIAAGGHLVIAVGSKPSLILNSFLRDLLPCEIGKQESDDLAQRLLRYGEGRPTQFTTLMPNPKTWVYTDRGAWIPAAEMRSPPIAVRGDYGAGSVTVVGFSLTARFLEQVTGKATLKDPAAIAAYRRWRQVSGDLLHRTHDPLQAQADQNLRQKGLGYLYNAATMPIPSKVEIATILIIYLLVLVPLLFVLFRAWKRLEYAWLLTPVVAVLFFAASHIAAFRNLEKALAINEIALVRLDESGRGSVFSQDLLYNPLYAQYDLSYSDKRVVPLYLRADQQFGIQKAREKYALTINEKRGAFSLDQLEVTVNGTRPMEYSGVIQMGSGMRIDLAPALRGGLYRMGEKVLGTVDNQLGVQLNHAALMQGNQAVLLAPIPANSKHELRVKKNWESTSLTPTEVMQKLATAAGKRDLKMYTGVALAALAGTDERVYFVAIVPAAPVVWQVNGKNSDMRRSYMILAQPCAMPAAPLSIHVVPYQDPDDVGVAISYSTEDDEEDEEAEEEIEIKDSSF